MYKYAYFLAFLILLNCSGNGDRFYTGDNNDAGSDGGLDSGDGSDTDTSSDTDADTDTDTGTWSNQEDGCGKVDFLFVIDNSISMGNEQEALINSFPGFIETIQTTLNADGDYHILVADSDSYGRCTSETCINYGNGCSGDKREYVCDNITAIEADACNSMWGAGVIYPTGQGASNRPCDIYGGNRYLIEGDPDLSASFACIAQVGLSGHPKERPMDAMVAAVSQKRNDPGGCNEGFLRDDAILVVTFVSDDGSDPDMSTPDDWDTDMGPSDSVDHWYDALVDAKNDNPEAVVVLGLISGERDSNNNMCGNSGDGRHWAEFISRFNERGIAGPVCEIEYVSFFEKAIELIDTTCDNFVPPLE